MQHGACSSKNNTLRQVSLKLDIWICNFYIVPNWFKQCNDYILLNTVMAKSIIKRTFEFIGLVNSSRRVDYLVNAVSMKCWLKRSGSKGPWPGAVKITALISIKQINIGNFCGKWNIAIIILALKLNVNVQNENIFQYKLCRNNIEYVTDSYIIQYEL